MVVLVISGTKDWMKETFWQQKGLLRLYLEVIIVGSLHFIKPKILEKTGFQIFSMLSNFRTLSNKQHKFNYH